MKRKYYNDAFIGNGNITASFSKYGELLRMYYPLPDYRQYIDYFHIGLKINDSNIIYLHKDINNKYNQYYTEDTNVLNTEIENTYFNLKVKQTDGVMINKDVMIKKYTFTNENVIDLNLNFLVHSKVVSSYNNLAGGLITNDALVQYSHNFTSAIFANQKLLSHQINNVESSISSGKVYDKDYIGMSTDSAISYDLGILKPKQTKEFTLFIFLSYDNDTLNKIDGIIDKIRKLNVDKEILKVEKYWKKFFEEHDTLKLRPDGSDYMDKLIKIYKRTILFIPLLINQKTGGITASLEIDEDRDRSGRYSYCWPRDAILVYTSMDNLGFGDYTEKFYNVFLRNTQNDDGMWEQRFYTDGRLAPCWGYQIDETALVVWGAYKHYRTIEKMYAKKRKKFLRDNLKMLEKATSFLEKYMNFILGIQNNDDKDVNKRYEHVSYDLWEMNEGVHLFSLSAIYAAFRAMIKIYEELDSDFEKDKQKKSEVEKDKIKFKKYMEETKQYILDNLYDKQKKVLLRNTKDELVDISVLGAITMFKVFDPEDQISKNTVELINMTLRTYSSGYLRFQGDTYIGGTYPWIVSTAWMAIYYKEIGALKEKNDCMRFIVNSQTALGFLSEQVKNDFSDRWVIGLGWSHSIFIETLID